MRKLAFILSIILIFTIPWEDAITVAGVASVTRYIGIITALVWMISVFVTGKIRRPHFIHFFIFLFLVWNIASTVWSLDVGETIEKLKTYFQLMILTYIIWDLYRTSNAIKYALQAYILGAFVGIITTLYNYSLGREINQYSGGRYAGVGNAVELALILSIGLPIAWFLATSKSKQPGNKILSLINYTYVPIALYAIVLTGTRMAIFSVIPAFIYIIGTFNRIKPLYRLLAFIALLFALVVIQQYIPQSVLERLGTTGVSISTGDLGGRVNLWRLSLLLFVEHPILGVGSGALPSSFVLGAQAHNIFISVLTEVGLIGFLIFLCILVIIFQQAYIQPKEYAKFWITILAIWTIGVFTLTWENKKVTWLLFSLIVVGANIVETQVVQLNQRYQINRLKPKLSPSDH